MGRGRTIVAILILLAGIAPSFAADPKGILVLYSYGPRFAPFNALSGEFRQELVRESPDPLVISEISVPGVREDGPGVDLPLVRYLHALFPEPPDLMVAVGGPAALAAIRQRETLFPDTPLLITATEARRIDPATLGERDVALRHVVDVPEVIQTILDVQPQVRRVLIVLGTSPLERRWRQFVEEDIAGFAGRVDFEFTTDLDFEATLARVAVLPKDFAVIYGLMITDAAGIPFEESQAIAAVSAASAVPVYGVYSSQLGQGIVGGRLVPIEALAHDAAGLAVRLLAGVPPRDLTPPLIDAGPPSFDSRNLVRFGIAEDQLPPGSQVFFREPPVWDRYRWPILASRRRLRRSELALSESEVRLGEAVSEARDFAGRLIRAQEDERSRLGRELHDDITQRLAVMAIDAGRAERGGDPARATALAGLREGLARLSDDVHALSYQLHPSILAELGLVAALEVEAERATRVDGLPVQFLADRRPEAVPPDVALCLYRVTQEALHNVARHAGARAARVTLGVATDRIVLSVEDDGRGFDPESIRRRPSLGIASMRQRVAAAMGTMQIETRPGRGTRIDVVLPLGGRGDEPAAALAG